MKRPHLVLYDYHTGGVWAFILAESAEQILATFPQLIVYSEPPNLLSPEVLARIGDTMDIDIDDRHNSFLAELAKSSD